ncbi:hypothetical protein SH611_17310 [Geminicoccaceae bacterium 1502E]|nr:hypothetical protein [Geminicoccaceae bacterium 1502E]
MNRSRGRLCGLLLAGLLAGPGQGRTADHGAPAMPARSAIDTVCEDAALDEDAPALAHWTASLAALCAARERDPGAALVEGTVTVIGRDPRALTVVARYRNLAPVHLRVGAVELTVQCADGQSGPAWAGDASWLAPGQSATTEIRDADPLWGQDCTGSTIASYTPTGRVNHLQAGVSGFHEQSARCPDGRSVPLALRMVDRAGEAWAFHAPGSRTIEVRFADYDAGDALGRICGTAGIRGQDRAYVADGSAWLSRDFHNLMEAWWAECARLGGDCGEAWAGWAATQPGA